MQLETPRCRRILYIILRVCVCVVGRGVEVVDECLLYSRNTLDCLISALLFNQNYEIKKEFFMCSVAYMT